MVRPGSSARLAAVAALLVVVLATLGSGARGRVGAQADGPPVDLPAVSLTVAELEAAGLAGYWALLASPADVDAATATLSDLQELDASDVEEALTDAGYLDGYRIVYDLPEVADDPGSPPLSDLVVASYLFEDAAGAEAAYETIADEGEIDDADDLSGAGQGIGDESELTSIPSRPDVLFDLPASQLELEILAGRLVLEISLYTFGEEAFTGDDVPAGDVEALESLGELLVDRGEDALESDAPGLSGMIVQVEGDAIESSYRLYDLMEGAPVRLAGETDQGFVDRVEGQLDRGTVSVVRNQQYLTAPTEELSELRLFNTILRFEDDAAAETYLAELADRLRGVEINVSVEVVDDDLRLGDGSLALALERVQADGETYVLTELFVRVGDTVGLVFIDQSEPITAGPEVSLDALIPLGEAQVACLEDGACDGPVPAPDEIVELIADRTVD